MGLPDKIHLELVTPIMMGLHLDVVSIIAPTTEGYVGILPGHTFYITSLAEGKLAVRFEGQLKAVRVGPGYMEVNPDYVVVVTEMMEGIGETIKEVQAWGIKYEEKM